MKWITHQTAGVGAALALHLPLEGVVAACLGAILPDKLDQAIAKRSRNPQRTFNQIHRGTTHWFGWWVAILLVACSHLVPPHWQPALLGIGLGGISHVVFLIGGSLGLAPTVLKRADYKLSFSKMTFPHQLMRVILSEQIYRSYRIINHEPYHK